jgi:hypothetical protein
MFCGRLSTESDVERVRGVVKLVRIKPWVLVVLFPLSLAVSCSRSDERVTAIPDLVTQPTYLAEPIQTTDSENIDRPPVCPPANGRGTISPDITIYTITFLVNGVEQVLLNGDTLDAMVGDEIEVKEVVICTESFSGYGGEACVDFTPIDKSRQEVQSEHAGTHMVQVISGFISIPGPIHSWARAENWDRISAVLNHWTQEDTEDTECADRSCEQDDWATIILR